MDLREIHVHAEIRRKDAGDWPAVMDKAMAATGVAAPMRPQIAASLRRAALMLVDRP